MRDSADGVAQLINDVLVVLVPDFEFLAVFEQAKGLSTLDVPLVILFFIRIYGIKNKFV